MADEYIKRKAAIQYFKERSKDFIGHDPIPPALVIMGCANEVDAIPAADVRPVVHAYWKTVDFGDGDLFYECSHCGEGWTLIDGTPKENNMEYCNRCGAQMDADMREVDDG